MFKRYSLIKTLTKNFNILSNADADANADANADADADADTDAGVTAIALPVLSYRRAKNEVQQGYHPCREHQHVIGMVLLPVNRFEFMLPACGCLNFLISRNISDLLKQEKENI